MVQQVQLGLRCGHLPTKTDVLDCTGGVYFMKASSNNLVAVFKPMDEEQGMPNNPKGHAGSGDFGLREFLKPGEGYIRETVSYLLDRGGFSKVPATTIVHCEHDVFNYARKYNGGKGMYPKLGSLQEFVRANDTFEDISPSLVSVLELQKIALLDLRLLNSDRNSSNILAIRKPSREQGHKGRSGSEADSEDPSDYSCGCMEEMELDAFLWDSAGPADLTESPSQDKHGDVYSLVPIDHGYCIPYRLRIDEFDWCWFWCPHVAEPIHPDVRDYVQALDIEEMLFSLTKQIPLSEDKKFLLRVTHHLLKEAVAAGLTLFDIASLIARTDGDVPSPVEYVLESAEDNAQRAIEMRAGRRNSGSPSFWKNVRESVLDGSERDGRPRCDDSPWMDSGAHHVHAVDRCMLPPLTRSCASDANLLLTRPHPFPTIKRGGISTQTTLHSSDGFTSDSTLSPRSPAVASGGYFQRDLTCPPGDGCGGAVLLGLKRPGAAPGDALITLQSYDSNFSRPNFVPDACSKSTSMLPMLNPFPTPSQRKTSSSSSSGRESADFENSSGLTSSAASSFESDDSRVGSFLPLVTSGMGKSNTPSPQTVIDGEAQDVAAEWVTNSDNDNGETDSEAEPNPGISSSKCANIAIPTALPLTSISRVVSFGAFESPPLYSIPKAERRVARLRQEKRKVIARTSEFLSLRLSFTQEALSSMVHKEARRRERVMVRGMHR